MTNYVYVSAKKWRLRKLSKTFSGKVYYNMS